MCPVQAHSSSGWPRTEWQCAVSFPHKVSHVNDSQEISLQHQREQEGETSSAGVRYGSSLFKLCGLSTGTAGRAAGEELGIKMVQMLLIVSFNYSCPCPSTFLCLAVQKWDCRNTCTKMGSGEFGTIALVFLWGVAEHSGLVWVREKEAEEWLYCSLQLLGKGQGEGGAELWDPVTEHMGVFKAASRNAWT